MSNKSYFQKFYLLTRQERNLLRFFRETERLKFSKDVNIKRYPYSWKKVFYKEYPRFEKIKLLTPKYLGKKNRNLLSFYSTLINRHSQRNFEHKCKTIDLERLSYLLYFSCGRKNLMDKKIFLKKFSFQYLDFSRMYPSAGARFPIEVYLVNFLIKKDLKRGVYHYNVKNHILEVLSYNSYKNDFLKAIKQNWVRKAEGLLILTAVFSRTIIKYGMRGWRYIFLEAGHMAQNIQLVGEYLNIGSCCIGDFIEEKIIEILDIDEKAEVPVYIIAFGA